MQRCGEPPAPRRARRGARQLAGRAVGGDQHPAAELALVGAAHAPHAVGIELGAGDVGLLDQRGAGFGGAARDALVADHALDGEGAILLADLRVAALAGHVALAARRDEAARGGVHEQAVGDDLLQHAHVFEDVQRRRAPSIAAILVAREARLVEQADAQRLALLAALVRQVIRRGRAAGAGADDDDVELVRCVRVAGLVHGHASFRGLE